MLYIMNSIPNRVCPSCPRALLWVVTACIPDGRYQNEVPNVLFR